MNILLAQSSPSFTLPPGQPLTLDRLYSQFIEPLANFLIAAGVVGAIIAIVVSGIMYLRAGSDIEAGKAKGLFKNGLIGALIILGVGVIINTVALVVTGGFFGFVPGGGGGPGPGPGSGQPGAACVTNTECSSGTFCRTQSGICVRLTGNVEGELCKEDADCRTGLECKRSGIFGMGQRKCSQP